MGYDNIWLYDIELDEIIAKLQSLYKPLFKKKWYDTTILENDVIDVIGHFFKNNKNYSKYIHNIKVHWVASKHDPNPYYANDIAYYTLHKIDIQKVI